MKKEKFLKGQALFAVARQKASELDVEFNNLKLVELIHRIQEREGHTACFRARKKCGELKCCWQLSCGAVMERK